MGAITGTFKGFGVTFSHMFRKVVTDRVPVRAAGRRRRATTAGTSSTGTRTAWRSASAASCAPGPARRTRSTSRAATTPRSSASRPVSGTPAIYQINYARCIFCGLCIEACPTRSLTMSNEYELARDNRQDLIFTKEQLLAPLLPGMEQPPHPMRLGDTEKDYYVGALTNPGTSAGAERSAARSRAPARRHGVRTRQGEPHDDATVLAAAGDVTGGEAGHLLDPRPARA